MKKLIHALLNYNVWANDRLLATVADLSEEQLNHFIPSSFPSVKKTLLHIWDGQEVWLSRLNGQSIKQWPSAAFHGTTGELIEGLKANSRALEEKGKSFGKSELKKEMQYLTFTSGAYTSHVYQMIMTVMNHGTYHRGQLVTMLRTLGIEKIPQTDFVFYTRETKKPEA